MSTSDDPGETAQRFDELMRQKAEIEANLASITIDLEALRSTANLPATVEPAKPDNSSESSDDLIEVLEKSGLFSSTVTEPEPPKLSDLDFGMIRKTPKVANDPLSSTDKIDKWEDASAGSHYESWEESGSTRQVYSIGSRSSQYTSDDRQYEFPKDSSVESLTEAESIVRELRDVLPPELKPKCTKCVRVRQKDIDQENWRRKRIPAPYHSLKKAPSGKTLLTTDDASATLAPLVTVHPLPLGKYTSMDEILVKMGVLKSIPDPNGPKPLYLYNCRIVPDATF
uniref:Uncharacterized protein n=1 Tax=Bracon brevicornis TaxID=1563983 RepID=A0A6V7HK17_9HYME